VLAVAHEKGDVRVYLHSGAARDVACAHLAGRGCARRPPVPPPAAPTGVTVLSSHFLNWLLVGVIAAASAAYARRRQNLPAPARGAWARRAARARRAAERATAWQPAGFQCVLHLSLHAASVGALALATAAGLLALGDESGRLSVVDLRQVRPRSPAAPVLPCRGRVRVKHRRRAAQAAVRHVRQLADQPIAALAFAAAGAPARGLAGRLAERRGAGEAPGGDARLALYVAAADCSLTVLEAGSGEPLGRDAWLRPRTADSAVALLALDAAGEPLPPPAALLPLPWACGSLGARMPAGRPPPECFRCRQPRPAAMQRPLFGPEPGHGSQPAMR